MCYVNRMEALDHKLADLSPDRKEIVDCTAVARKAIPGDHIAVPFGGAWVDGCYTGLWHHGIFAGVNEDNEPIAIEMSGRTDIEASIKEVTLERFRGGETVFAIVVYDADTDVLKGTTLNKARLALQLYKDDPQDLYNALGSNCEHFATWCRTGRSVNNLSSMYQLVCSLKVSSQPKPTQRHCYFSFHKVAF